MSSWLESLKVGDRVICEDRYLRTPVECTVDKLTAVYILTSDGRKWHRRGKHAAKLVGGRPNYSQPHILGRPEYLADKESADKAFGELSALFIRAYSRAGCKLTPDQLRRMAAIAQEAKDDR